MKKLIRTLGWKFWAAMLVSALIGFKLGLLLHEVIPHWSLF